MVFTPTSAGLRTGSITVVDNGSNSPQQFTVQGYGEGPTITTHFVYVTNLGSNDISAYEINGVTGALTEIAGSPFPGLGMFSFAVAADPSADFIYVLNSQVGEYAVSPTTGALTEINFFNAGLLSAITIDPLGRFAYVPSVSNEVSAFTIDGITGELTPVAGSPFAAETPVEGNASAAVDFSDGFLYVTNTGSAYISAYVIDAATGALAPVPGSPFSVTEAGWQIAADPAAGFVYTISGRGNVWAYAIDAATGALAPVGSPLAAGFGAVGIAIDPSGKFAYAVTNVTNGKVSAYTIDPTTGALTPVAGSPFAGVTDATAVAVDPSGKFVYVTNGDDDVSAYSIDRTTGALTPVPGTPFAAHLDPIGIAVK
ncbi:MAG: lactonase family protein [Candidatus Binataceae bacterium]